MVRKNKRNRLQITREDHEKGNYDNLRKANQHVKNLSCG